MKRKAKVRKPKAAKRAPRKRAARKPADTPVQQNGGSREGTSPAASLEPNKSNPPAAGGTTTESIVGDQGTSGEVFDRTTHT